jgi:hypothetical protein
MRVPKMVKNGFNSRFQVPEVLASAKKLWSCSKIKPVSRPQKKNKNHLKPISEQPCCEGNPGFALFCEKLQLLQRYSGAPDCACNQARGDGDRCPKIVERGSECCLGVTGRSLRLPRRTT